jgi:hypothetical protein
VPAGKQSVSRVLGISIALACLLPLCWWMATRTEFHRTVGRDITLAQCPISGLPASATHIDYALGALGPGMEYEFDTSEADFRAWAQSNGWPLQSITPDEHGGLWRIDRYGFDSGDPHDPKDTQIANGLRYEWADSFAKDNRLAVAYDLDRHRAYYARSYR